MKFQELSNNMLNQSNLIHIEIKMLKNKLSTLVKDLDEKDRANESLN